MSSDELVFEIEHTREDYKHLRSPITSVNNEQSSEVIQQSHLQQQQQKRRENSSDYSSFSVLSQQQQQQQKKSFPQEQTRFSTSLNDKNINNDKNNNDNEKNNKTKSFSPREEEKNNVTSTTMRTTSEKNSSSAHDDDEIVDDDRNNIDIVPTTLKEAIERTNQMQDKKQNYSLIEMFNKFANKISKTENNATGKSKNEKQLPTEEKNDRKKVKNCSLAVPSSSSSSTSSFYSPVVGNSNNDSVNNTKKIIINDTSTNVSTSTSSQKKSEAITIPFSNRKNSSFSSSVEETSTIITEEFFSGNRSGDVDNARSLSRSASIKNNVLRSEQKSLSAQKNGDTVIKKPDSIETTSSIEANIYCQRFLSDGNLPTITTNRDDTGNQLKKQFHEKKQVFQLESVDNLQFLKKKQMKKEAESQQQSEESKRLSLKDLFVNMKKIGFGTHSNVFVAKFHNRQVIVKQLRKPSSKNSQLNKENEICSEYEYEKKSLKDLNHPFIRKLVANLELPDSYNLLLEYVHGPVLFDFIRYNHYLKEELYKFYGLQLAIVMNYIHKNGFVFVDLKPENVLIAEDGYLKLFDFGHCTPCREGHLLKGQAGTKGYCAPEILYCEIISHNCDVWSFGMTMFTMIRGYLLDETTYEIARTEDEYYDKLYHDLDAEYKIDFGTKIFLNDLLRENFQSRLSFEQILHHRWFLPLDRHQIEQKKMPAPWRPYRPFLNKNIINTQVKTTKATNTKNEAKSTTATTMRSENIYCQPDDLIDWDVKYWNQNYKQPSISDALCKAMLGKYKKRWRKIREETKEANSF